MIKVLFICHGNICRSPMAEYLFRDYVDKNNNIDNFIISSKATSSEEIGNPIYPPVKKLLLEYGIDTSSHRASKLTKEMYDQYDYLIVMDDNNYRNTLRIIGSDSLNKVHKLLEYTNLNRDILDPWYTRDFKACYNDILLGIKGFYSYLINHNL